MIRPQGRQRVETSLNAGYLLDDSMSAAHRHGPTDWCYSGILGRRGERCCGFTKARINQAATRQSAFKARDEDPGTTHKVIRKLASRITDTLVAETGLATALRLPEYHGNHLVQGVQPTGVPLVSLVGEGTPGATHVHPWDEVPRYHGNMEAAVSGLPN
ncbi:hypothetical protein H4Q26_013947 [Puccinia striiformis f. sp. tritici PST-130]|nr:hypothetical protein H4Q26_013947 [Puccinia striiformis f. sp. tritici PST-130]